MCLQCDGYSEEDVRRMIDLHIRVYGYHITQVDDRAPWCYTIGLQENFGHAELVTADLEMSAQLDLIRTVAQMLLDDGAVDHLYLRALGVSMVPVHRRHLDAGLVGMWESFYDRTAAPGEFVQVLPPTAWFCPGHGATMTRLDRPPATRRTS